MKVLRRLDEIKRACRRAAAECRLGFVPTMGALHDGHLSLVRAAREADDAVAVSIFVNPLQFGANEDLAAYPRDEQADLALLEAADVDLVLLLDEREVYPDGFVTRVQQPSLTAELEGASRPGHFDGVLTVVTKLFHIVGAQRAYFGRKDFQQTVVVRRLVRDLDLPVEVVVCDTRRDEDGLALSSRNAYLSAAERARGLTLVDALADVERAFEEGERSVSALEERLRSTLAAGLGHDPDYASIRSPDDLSPRERAEPGDIVLVAARVGPTRLLDNHPLGVALGPFRRPERAT